jgi:type IV fimbrial biogenesis protein FimT
MSLIELLVTLAVAALVAGLGVPSFLRVVARHAIAAQAEALQDAVRVGRNEAMKRSGPVVLCRTDAGNTSHCAGSGGDLQTWLLFADVARSGTFVGGDAASIRFDATGSAHSDAGQAVFVLSPAGWSAEAPGSGRASQRQVCVNPRGEVAIIDGNATCP